MIKVLFVCHGSKCRKYVLCKRDTVAWIRDKGTGSTDIKDALILAGLDWHVVQEPVYTGQNELVQGYKANVRDSDRKVLGVVTDRYKIVQNEEAFSYTDVLLGEGVRYETAGSLQGGKSVWLLAHLPHEYIISGERISPYHTVFQHA